MRIVLSSVFVDDQERALEFYTQVMGFIKKTDLPAGKYRFLTVASPEDPDGPELLLEPNDNPAARTYQRAIYEQGIPAASFAVENMEEEYKRLNGLGVAFTTKPTQAGAVIISVIDDTCGNLIQIAQV